MPFDWINSSHVKVERLDAGTGTVTVVAGVATFSSAQTTLDVGSHVRISGSTYTIDSRTSDTVFSFTTRPTISSSAFHLPDDAVALVFGSTFTLTGTSGAASITTSPAVASTALLRVYRDVPYTQTVSLPSTGPVPTEAIETALDRTVMQVQQLATAVENAGIIVPQGGITSDDTTTFADSTARNAATPSRVGQLAVQLDTAVLYYGSAVSQGSWTVVSKQSTQYHATSYAGLTPEFVGQLAIIGSTGVIYRGTATTLGAWAAVKVYQTPFDFTWTPWLAGDPLIPGQKRWAGNFPLGVYAITNAFICCDTNGAENAEVKVYLGDGTRQLTDANIVLSPEENGSGLITSLSEYAEGTIQQMYRVAVEIVSTGASVSVTSTGGSTVSTPSGSDLPTLQTGVGINVLGENNNAVIVAVRGDGTVVRSHPAQVTGSESILLGPRTLVRGVTVALTGGVTTIPALTADLALIAAGDRVIGPTIPPGTFVVDKDASNFYINNPTTGATTLVTVVNNERPPVQHFTVISEAAGQTVIGVPTTEGILVGDRPYGLYVPTTAYITAIDPGVSFTISSAITGGTATEITVRPPVRVATVTAGSTTATLNHTTGLLVGSKVTGPGVPPDTYILTVASPNITVNNELSLALSGAATDLFEFTRETVQLPVATTDGSTTLTLAFAVNTTPVVAGMVVEGDGIQPGTLVDSVGGSTITLTKVAKATQVAANVRFRAAPAKWAGLQLTLTGYVTGLSLA